MQEEPTECLRSCQIDVAVGIVLVNMRDGQTLIQAELYKGQENEASPLVQKKKNIFGKIVATVNKAFDENFPG